MKNILIAGGAGFIGHHLANRLKSEGNFVRIVDIKDCEYPCNADEQLILDLRHFHNCKKALYGKVWDEVYQLAADMGGMGFILNHDLECLTNSVRINLNMLEATSQFNVKRYFYASSVCVYRDVEFGESALSERDAYPALPDNDYGWEKLYSERVALSYARRKLLNVRIARFQNCYGEEGTWFGGREKAPAALCRKVALAENGGKIQIWGKGNAVRAYIYVKDLIEAVITLMRSDIIEPVNIGVDDYYSVDSLVDIICKIAGKTLIKEHVIGNVGVLNRNFSNALIYTTGWKPKFSLEEGIKITYPWIKKEVEKLLIQLNK